MRRAGIVKIQHHVLFSKLEESDFRSGGACAILDMSWDLPLRRINFDFWDSDNRLSIFPTQLANALGFHGGIVYGWTLEFYRCVGLYIEHESLDEVQVGDMLNIVNYDPEKMA